MGNLIEQAIREKKLLEFTYNDKHRVVEPHKYGMINGEATLESFQPSGGSSHPGTIPEWRNFKYQLIRNLAISSTGFTCRDDFNPTRIDWDYVFAQVDLPHR